MKQKGSADLTFEIKDDAFEIGFVEDLLAFGRAKEKGATTEVIDLAGDALGMVVDASQEPITKDLALTISNAEMVLDVACSFLDVKGFEVETDSNALVESLVRGETEFVS